jgi:hypothetical protein
MPSCWHFHQLRKGNWMPRDLHGTLPRLQISHLAYLSEMAEWPERFGGGASELVSLNENSIWSGPWRSRANPKALGALPSIRSLLSSGNLTAAGQSVLANMASSPTSPQGYQPLGNLSLEFGHSSSGMSSYTRYQDTYEGTAFVTYNYGGVNYT